MSDEQARLDVEAEKLKNPETNPLWNREPGIAVIPGSNYAREMAKFEQFPSHYTFGTQPGNPYVYRPYPKMLYRAEHFNGKIACMAAPPDSYDFPDTRSYERADEAARRFTERCQKIVRDEREMQRAMEAGWRESPSEAVAYLEAKDEGRATATAERIYDDRRMSPKALAEADAVTEAVGGEHVPEIPEKLRRRRKPKA